MGKIAETALRIVGMHCAGCAAGIEKGVKDLNGVEECQVNYATHSAVVQFDSQITNTDGIVDRIIELGYQATPGTPDILTANDTEVQSARQRFMTALFLSLPLVFLHLWHLLTAEYIISYLWDNISQGILAALVLFVSGNPILIDAFKQARRVRANMNTLISMGTATAFGWSAYALIAHIVWQRHETMYFDSAGMIITLILLGRFLEAKSKSKAGDAIRALVKLQPAITIAVINGVEVEIEAASAKPGMTLQVKPGERIPADGEIIQGTPSIDEAMLTGESIPVEKKQGDNVFGGSLNGNSPFTMQVTASGEKSFLAQIIRLVTEAQGKKAPVQKLADRVAGVFVPIVIGLAGLTLLLWFLFDPTNELLVRSVISVLIIACPCALGLATPTAILAGTGRAAREGIIIRGGDILETITKVDTVVFDKTGTLTCGELEVVSVRNYGQVSERSLIRLAGSIEKQSEHPIARAIVNHLKTTDLTVMTLKNVQALPGFGMKADLDARTLLIGNRTLLENENVRFGDALNHAEEEMTKGRTIVFVALDGEVVGLFAVADRLRSEAKEVVASLQARMQRVVLISGDNRRTVEGIARTVGLDHYEVEIKPDQKKVIVESYRRAGYTVAMVGDGINDAPALAAADIGVAIGSGTDVAIEASDVVLMQHDLTTIPKMFELANASMKVIKQNLFWAFFYNILAIPIAAGLLYPVFNITLSPTIAAATMALSSVFVVTNSLRLNRITL